MRRRLALLSTIAVTVAGAAAPQAGSTSTAASQALDRVERLLSDGRVTDDATPAFRDLALALPQLRPAERSRAQAVLARPSYTATPRSLCMNVCVHWVDSTADAPPLRDGNGNRIPDWVDTTMAVMEEIWAKQIVQFGFRPPKSDLAIRSHGPDGRLDVYLQDIANEVLGYCVPEVPSGYSYYDVPGYCVLDDDYSLAQLGAPGLGGRKELEMTAAHEFFHAVQFAYDFAEDGWLLEGTATWMEDEMYDRVNEPYSRFPYSPLLHPEVPVDFFSREQPFQYGSWVFWRFLEELFSPENGPRDPTVIRRVWELADGSPGAPDLYSLQAADALAREKRSSLRSAFVAFGIVNFVPQAFYSEGREWPKSPAARSFAVTAAKRDSGRQRLVLDHLTHRHIVFTPGAGVRGSSRLTITVDLPSINRGSEASAMVFRRGAPIRVERMRLTPSGNGTVTVPFGRGAIQRIVLVLTNASERYTCGLRTVFSCSGRPLDDDQPFLFRAQLR